MDDKTRRKRSYAAGYLLSLAGKPLPLSTKREPVAYLYNGVRLPKLPEWDKETYPYAVMFFVQKSITDPTPMNILFLLKQKAEIGIANMVFSGGGAVACYEIIGNGNEWQKVAAFDTEAGDNIEVDGFLTAPTSSGSGWSNYDVLRQDGSVYLQGTEPIPVYD